MRWKASLLPVVSAVAFTASGCAPILTPQPTTLPSTVETDVANAEPGAMTSDVQRESGALHAFLVGQLSLNDEDFKGAMESFAEADELSDSPAPAIHVKLSELYLRFGELDKALMAAKKALSEDPTDPHTRLLYAGVLDSVDRDDEAEPIYRGLIQEYPGKFDSYILLSNLYMKQHKLPQALDTLKALVARHPKESLGHYYLGRAYEQTSDFARAEVEYTKVFEADPALSNGAVELLRVLLRQKKTEKAKAICERILRKDPNDQLARKVIGHLMLGESKLDAALKHLEVLKDLEADSTDTRFKVALIQIEKENFKEAVRELNLVLAKDPQHDEARYYLASIYAGTGKHKEALEELDQIGEKSSMYVKGRTFAALILRQDEELDRARDAVEEALGVEPKNKNLILYRILLLRDQEEYEEAEEQVRAALQSDPDDERYLFNLALVLHDRGQKAQAADVMESVLKKNPVNADALNYVAYELAEQGKDLPRAEELVRRAIQLRPNDGFYLDTLGWIQYRQGKIADAEQSLARAISASGDDLVIVEHYIEILLTQGKSSKAVAVMKAVVEQAPLTEQLEDAERAAAFKRIQERLQQLLREHPELHSVEKIPLKRAMASGRAYSQVDMMILEEFGNYSPRR